jgi:hypothetical protein
VAALALLTCTSAKATVRFKTWIFILPCALLLLSTALAHPANASYSRPLCPTGRSSRVAAPPELCQCCCCCCCSAHVAVNGTATPGKTITFEVTLPNGQKVTRSCTTGSRRAGTRQASPGTCSVIVSSPVPGTVVATATAPGASGPVTSTSPGPDGRPTNGQSSTVQVVAPPVGDEKLVLSAAPSQVPVGGNITLTATYTGAATVVVTCYYRCKNTTQPMHLCLHCYVLKHFSCNAGC